MKKPISTGKKRFDIILLITVGVIALFGLLMIYSASSFIAFRDFADKYYYLKEQSLWLVLGVLSMGFFAFFDYHRFYNLALGILILAIILLIMVFIPGFGVSIYGAQRWVSLGFTTIQPSEFVKIALAIYLAAWFSTKEKGRFSAFLLLLGFILLLVMLQPNMGTAIIILSESLIVYFLSGGNMRQLLGLLPILGIGGIILIAVAPYRLQRLMAFLNINQSVNTSSYHVKQILIALGSGGLTGLGLGNSLQKYAYLPENTTDSIFAIIAEEVGFLGSLFLIILYIVLVCRGFMIAKRAKDQFGKLLAGGIIGYLAVQTIMNLGTQTALIPLTGVPLPFVSYGGSSLVMNFTAIGILLNIGRQAQSNV